MCSTPRHRSSEYRVVRWSLDGDSVRVVRRGAEAPAVGDAELERIRDRLMEITDGTVQGQLDRIPDHKPFIRDLFTDDEDRLWVQRYIRAPEGVPGVSGTRFDVFGPDGRLQMFVELDRRIRTPVVISSGRLYATVRPGGVPTVMAYRVPTP